MKETRVEVDATLRQRARNLAAGLTDREVVENPLPRLVASKQQDAMVDGIAALRDLPDELGAPARRQRHGP